jgi:tetratricopeptide (TPR) repeat protein
MQIVQSVRNVVGKSCLVMSNSFQYFALFPELLSTNHIPSHQDSKEKESEPQSPLSVEEFEFNAPLFKDASIPQLPLVFNRSESDAEDLKAHQSPNKWYICPWVLDYWGWSIVSRGFPPAPKPVRDWNFEYQQLLELPVSSDYEMKQRNDALTSLTSDFMAFASKTCDTLVREILLPNDARTIPQLSQTLGLAGGDKYIWGNCFFKFAKERSTSGNLYGGDAFAAKAASNELRAMNAILDCHIIGLHLPLAAVFHCRGHCILASVKVPIDGVQTLVCGSCDGGVTIRNDSSEVKDICEYLSGVYNLRKHWVTGGSTDGPSHELVTAGDVEFHLSKEDGRLYVVDCARLFPPTPCLKGNKEYMFNQYRPEFMKNLPPALNALCSDAYTRWSTVEAASHVRDVEIAFMHLREVLVPKCAQIICELKEDMISGLRETLHEVGVNIRHLGLILSHVPQNSIGRLLVSFEMFCRVCKVRLRSCFRHTSCVTDSSFLILASRFLLDIMGTTSYSHVFWNEVVSRDISQKFAVEFPSSDVQMLRNVFCSTYPFHDSLTRHFLCSVSIGFVGSSSELLELCCNRESFNVDYIIPGISLLIKVKQTVIPPVVSLKHAVLKLAQIIDLREQALGSESPALMGSLNHLFGLCKMYGSHYSAQGFDVACKLVRITKNCYEANPSLPAVAFDYADAMLNLGRFILQIGSIEDPSGYFEKAYELFNHLKSTKAMVRAFKSLRKLAMVRHREGRMKECEKLLQDGLKYAVSFFGPKHEVVALMLNRIGWFYDTLDMLREAREAFREALSIREDVLHDSFHTASSLVYLAGNYRAWARICPSESISPDEIQTMYERAVSMMKKLYRTSHFKTNDFYNGLAGYYASQTRFNEAFTLYDKVLESRIRHHGSSHVQVAWTLNSLANCHLQSDPPNLLKAGQCYIQALEILEREPTPPLNNIAWTKRSVAKWLLKVKESPISMDVFESISFRKDWDFCKDNIVFLAQKLVLECLEIQLRIFHLGCPRLADTYMLLAEIDFSSGNAVSANAYLNKARDIYEVRYSKDSAPYQQTIKLAQF